MKAKTIPFKEKRLLMEAISDLDPEIYDDFRRWMFLSMFARYCKDQYLPEEAYSKDLHKLKIAAAEFIGRAEADIRDYIDYLED